MQRLPRLRDTLKVRFVLEPSQLNIVIKNQDDLGIRSDLGGAASDDNGRRETQQGTN